MNLLSKSNYKIILEYIVEVVFKKNKHISNYLHN